MHKATKFAIAMRVVKVALIIVGTVTTWFMLKELVLPFLLHWVSCTLPEYYHSLRDWVFSFHPCVFLGIITIAIASSSLFETQSQYEKRSFRSKAGDFGVFGEENVYHVESVTLSWNMGNYSSFHGWNDEKTIHKEEVEEKEVISFVSYKNIIHTSHHLTPAISSILCYACSKEQVEKVEIHGDNDLEEDSLKKTSETGIKETCVEQDDVASMDEVWKMIMEDKKREETLQLVSVSADGPPSPGKLQRVAGQLGDVEKEVIKGELVVVAREEPKKSMAQSSSFKRRETMSPEELNSRVEEFIKQFNLEMKLQRQDSVKGYSDMLRRGIHR